MIQKLGGGRILDYGPSAAIHARGRVPGGVMVSQAIVSGSQRENLRGLSAIGGHASSLRKKPLETADARKARYAAFKVRHADCDCHELIGGQPRPKGYRERERDRNRLRRELRRAAKT